MNINDNTKISDIIKENKSAIDAIAQVAPPLQRLKNPILRKVMASRVNIKEAAKMGGCTVDDIVNALKPLGYHYESVTGTSSITTSTKPTWLTNANEENIITYDVRPIIESGTDPLKAILGKFKEVAPGGILCIINSFVPTPLIHLLKQEKAEDSFVDIISESESHTYFIKKQKETPLTEVNSKDKVIMDDSLTFAAVYNSFNKEAIKEIDVRHLEMPGPMQTILATLGEMQKGNALYVNHKRVPVYLLEELADKNYEVHIHTIDDNNVKMLLFERQ